MSARTLLEAIEIIGDDGSLTGRRIKELLEADAAPAEVEIDLTLDDVGQLLHVSAETIRAACVRGEFPGSYKRAGREWRVPKAAIVAYQEGEQERHRERQLRENGGYAALGSKRSSGVGRSDETVSVSSGGVCR